MTGKCKRLALLSLSRLVTGICRTRPLSQRLSHWQTWHRAMTHRDTERSRTIQRYKDKCKQTLTCAWAAWRKCVNQVVERRRAEQLNRLASLYGQRRRLYHACTIWRKYIYIVSTARRLLQGIVRKRLRTALNCAIQIFKQQYRQSQLNDKLSKQEAASIMRRQRIRAKRIQLILTRRYKSLIQSAWRLWIDMCANATKEEEELQRKLGKILNHWQGKSVRTIFRAWKGCIALRQQRGRAIARLLLRKAHALLQSGLAGWEMLVVDSQINMQMQQIAARLVHRRMQQCLRRIVRGWRGAAVFQRRVAIFQRRMFAARWRRLLHCWRHSVQLQRNARTSLLHLSRAIARARVRPAFRRWWTSQLHACLARVHAGAVTRFTRRHVIVRVLSPPFYAWKHGAKRRVRRRRKLAKLKEMFARRKKQRVLIVWQKRFVTQQRKQRRCLHTLLTKKYQAMKSAALFAWQRVCASIEVENTHACYTAAMQRSAVRMLAMTLSRGCLRAVARGFHAWSFIVMQLRCTALRELDQSHYRHMLQLRQSQLVSTVQDSANVRVLGLSQSPSSHEHVYRHGSGSTIGGSMSPSHISNRFLWKRSKYLKSIAHTTLLPDMLRADPPPHNINVLNHTDANTDTNNNASTRRSVLKENREDTRAQESTQAAVSSLPINMDNVAVGSLQVPIFQHVHSLTSKHNIDPQHESQMYSLYIEQYKAKMRSQALFKAKANASKVNV